MRVEALPAVTLPPSRKTGRSFASFSAEASGRGPSSASTRTVSRPLRRLDRDDLLGQPAGLGGGDGALVAAQGEGVLVLAADPVALGDVLAGLAHRLGRDAELGHARVDHPPAEGRVVHRLRAAGEGALGLLDDPGRPAHRLDPAGQVEVALAELDRAGGAVDRLQAGGAEAVDGGAGNAVRQAGQQRRHPRHVAVVLARLVGGAEVDVDDPLRVDAGALDHGADRVRGEIVGADAGEGAAVGAHRGSQRLDYVCVGHRGEPYPGRVLYILGTLAVLAFMIGVLVLVGHFYPGSGADLRRLEADPLARGRGPERDRRHPPDDGGAERDAPPPRRSRR